MKGSISFLRQSRPSRDHAWLIFIAATWGASCFHPPRVAAAQEAALATGHPPKSSPVARALPANIDATIVVEGKKLFHDEAHCFHCHGKNGAGTFFGPSLSDGRRINLKTASYEEINRLIHTGVPKPKHHLGAMPPMGGASLSEDQIRALAAYVFTLDRGQ